MSRLHLDKSQIDLLDYDTLDELRLELNDELAALAQVERLIYQRRRELDLEKNPDLLNQNFSYLEQEYDNEPTNKHELSTNELIQLIRSSGIDPQDLKEFIK